MLFFNNNNKTTETLLFTESRGLIYGFVKEKPITSFIFKCKYVVIKTITCH